MCVHSVFVHVGICLHRGVGTATTGMAMAVALFCMNMMSSFHRRMAHAPNI